MAIERCHANLINYFDAEKLKGDIILITGTLFKHQKFFYTNLFLNTSNPSNESTSSTDATETSTETSFAEAVNAENNDINDNEAAPYTAVGCCATRALGSAGWDCKDINLVFSIDFPTSLIAVAQEKGRVGRQHGCMPAHNCYYVCGSLESYVSHIRCIH